MENESLLATEPTTMTSGVVFALDGIHRKARTAWDMLAEIG